MGCTQSQSAAAGTPPTETDIVGAQAAVAQGQLDHATAAGVVQGVAIGQPIAQQRKPNAPPAGDTGSSAEVVVAESFLYSPQMAKVFAQFDTDRNGALDLSELRKLLQAIGLREEDAESALSGFDRNGDSLIQLSEWEQGLTPGMRSAIEAQLGTLGN